MRRSDFRFLERLRVRWAEIDSQRIVFNAHYLTYLRHRRRRLLARARAVLRGDDGELRGDLFVRKATLEYRASARYDEVLDVGIALRARRQLVASLRRDRASARTSRWSSASWSTSSPIPTGRARSRFRRRCARVLRRLRGRRSRCSTFASAHGGSSRRQRRPIRAEVFIGEQQIPADMEWDDADADAVHAVAFNRLGRASAPAACSSTFPASPRSAGWRWQQARATAASAAPCSTRCSPPPVRAATARRCCTRRLGAAPFYERAGFVRRGPEFDEAGIAHVEMLRVL